MLIKLKHLMGRFSTQTFYAKLRNRPENKQQTAKLETKTQTFAWISFSFFRFSQLLFKINISSIFSVLQKKKINKPRVASRVRTMAYWYTLFADVYNERIKNLIIPKNPRSKWSQNIFVFFTVHFRLNDWLIKHMVKLISQ